MVSRRMWSRAVAALGCGALLSAALAGCSSSTSSPGSSGSSSSGPVTISLLAGGNDPAATKFATDLAAAFHKANPTITVKVETRPGGTDGDNLVKTRLATGSMNDVFLYNTGSLFQALHPDQTLQPLADQPWVKDLTSDFKKTVSTSKALYGAPNGSTFDGGIMYNKKVYARLGLSVPTTWAQFISNSKKIKAA